VRSRLLVRAVGVALAVGACVGITAPVDASSVGDAIGAPTGRLAFVTGTEESQRLEVANLDGSQRVAITQPSSRPISALEWSPDGTSLLYLDSNPSRRGRSKNSLKVASADGTVSRSVARWPRLGPGIGMGVWSPDGTRIAFSQERSQYPVESRPGDLALYVVHADGTGLQAIPNAIPPWSQRFGDRFVYVDPLGWSPDGTTRFYCVSTYSNGVRVNDWVSSVIYGIGQDRARRRIAKLPNLGGLWLSPDALAIAFVPHSSGEIHLVDVATGSIRPLVVEPFTADESSSVEDLVWLPGAREIVFAEDVYGAEGELLPARIRAVDVSTGAVRALNQPVGDGVYRLVAAHDGTSFGYDTFTFGGPPTFDVVSRTFHVLQLDGTPLAQYSLDPALDAVPYLD
jgi:Tol biopolymer transport system component